MQLALHVKDPLPRIAAYRRYLETRHSTQVKKAVGFTKIKVTESKSCITNFICTATDDSEDALEASCLVSCRVVKAVKEHFLAEGLIGHCVKVVGKCPFGEKAG
jgi:hypothetical protein